MIPAAFDYIKADSKEAAIEALTQHGDEAKLLAGGHSLIPLMRFRLARPSVIVDIGRIQDLSYVKDEGDHLAIGALTRHRDVETSELVLKEAPLLAAATKEVGDPQVRHRGTIGGSVAHGDSASDIPSVLMAQRASLVVQGPGGNERVVGVDDFFKGFLETDLSEDELLTEIRLPKAAGAGWSFQKFNRRAQDWAIVGVAALLQEGECGVGLVNMHSTPIRASAVEEAVNSGADPEAAAEMADQGCEPTADLNASVEYRQHLAKVLTKRALREAAS